MSDESLPMTMAGALAWAAANHPDRAAYSGAGRGGGRTITWSELHSQSLAFAAGLIALGMERGDRVAVCAENSIEWIIACHGTSLAGGVFVPIYYDLKEQEIADQLGRPECRFLVTTRDVLPKVPQVSHGLQHIILIDGTGGAESASTPGSAAPVLAFGAVLASATSESRQALPARGPAPDDLMVLIYTSGTTGGPKGVMISHRNMLSNAHAVLETLPLRATDVVLLVLPLHHAMPFMATVLLPALLGAKVVIENDVRRVRDRLAAEKPTVFFGVPALFEIMYRNIIARAEAEGRGQMLATWQRRLGAIKRATGVNLAPLVFRPLHQALGGNLRFLVSGGAALNPETARNFFSLGIPLIQGWGMSEASPVISIQRFSPWKFRLTPYYERHAGSVGPAIQGVEISQIDVPDKDIYISATGEGELLVRGENVFQGYWQAEDLTGAAKVDGWLKTGDLGRIDRDGNIYLTGRSKYIIVLESGEKVHPDEVEEKLGTSNVIQDVCIVGRKQRDKTQVTAVIYPEPDLTLDALRKAGLSESEDAVRQLVQAEVERLGRELAPYKRVVQVIVTDTPLPKTALQKVAREQLPDDFEFSLRRWQETKMQALG
jgi:long-chain acyl-CoA synthetase